MHRNSYGSITMSDITDLQKRIDSEFAAGRERTAALQQQAVKTYEDRQARLATFNSLCERLQSVWRPRFELLQAKFGENVKVTPSITREARRVVLAVDSPVASVKLEFSASTDTDVRNLVLQYDLEILPIYMQFKGHDEVAFPLDAVDDAAVGRWFDDRIVDFVQTYLSLSENQYYLKDHMVTDPVAKVSFPSFAAAATITVGKNVFHFISQKTCDEFKKSNP